MTASSTRLAACLLVLCGLLSGCISRSDEYDNPVEAQLAELKKNQESASLSFLTDFDWDTVHFFKARTSQEQIDSVLGPGRASAYGSADSSAKSSLVFERAGEIVEQMPLGEFALSADRVTWPHAVMAMSYGEYDLRLVEPPTR